MWKCQSLTHIRLIETPWPVVCQAPLSREFSRKEYWSGKPFFSPRDLPDPGIEPGNPKLGADSLPSEVPGKPLQTQDDFIYATLLLAVSEYFIFCPSTIPTPVYIFPFMDALF